ncbi:MAG TPA: 30S ribosomal protein S12 methylthiotransferase RimO [Actinobacteria bacterium]|nr:30S ribosomal protein S12 methylthiotransferase RimO [Actinomycetota bacterium]
MTSAPPRRVAVITLGCARNEVDSEELAGRLAAEGWELVDEPADAEAVLVNTCGFVDVAKKDSIDTILAAADLKASDSGPRAVVAVGCLAERYGEELASSLPEADAVLGFDDYSDISTRLTAIVAGERHVAHAPRDRRHLLPLSPVERPAVAQDIPGHASVAPGADEAVGGWSPPVLRRRLEGSPVAPVKLASGCDRRCTFCAIPSFRGSFISRPPQDVLTEMSWLTGQGVREVVLVSENSTSYGKDLGDLRLLEELLAGMGETGVARVRVAYLQPAEVRPGLLETIAREPLVASYFDLSFQHASPTVLRRMRRFGGREEFLGLISRIRELAPDAGIRSNVIVGFPGETQEEFDDLMAFLEAARLDAVGVFGYSDEDGTEAAMLPGKLSDEIIASRVEEATTMAEEVMAQRAEERIGQRLEILIESVEEDDLGRWVATGRAEHQGPDDGSTAVVLSGPGRVVPGDLITAVAIDALGVDLVAEPVSDEDRVR